MVLTYSLLVPLSGNGSQIKNPISGRDLSCDESRRPPRGRLRGRSGPPALSSDPGGGLEKNRGRFLVLTSRCPNGLVPFMARKLRLQYEGAVYHVMNRGNHREDIFRDDSDRRLFLDTLEETCAKTHWHVHAWCLMSNHFHLVIETPRANLVDGMKWLLATYTLRSNHRHKLSGHLFSGRYKALFVDESESGYLKTACDYVHLNPVRAKLLKAQDSCATTLGAASRSTSGTQSCAGPGSRSESYSGSTEFPKTVRLDARSLRSGWKCGGGRRRQRSLRACSGAGFWGAKPFARSCWA